MKVQTGRASLVELRVRYGEGQRDPDVDEAKRAILEAEIDAYVARQVFGLSRHQLDFMLETFGVLLRREMRSLGEYRTRRVILEIYDAMAEAARTGRPNVTRLDPPPADPRVDHPDTRERA